MLTVRGNSIHFRHTNGCSCYSVKVFETENVSTWGGLEPPIFGSMRNALTIWATRTRYLLPHVFEYWLCDIDSFEVKLTFEMLTVRGQQHSFSTHERMSLLKCQIVETKNEKNVLGEGGTLNLRIHAECSNHFELSGQDICCPMFLNTSSGGIQIQIQIQKAFIQENTQTHVDQSWDWNPWGFICLIISWIAITLRTF